MNAARGQGLQERVDAARERADVPALGVLVARGDAVQVAVSGTSTAGSDEIVSPGDAWHIGSCSKAVTALLAARLVDRGVIGWETTVADVLHDLPASVGEQAQGLTLRQLLSHTTGLPGREADGVVLPIARLQEAMGGASSDQRRAVANAVLSLEPVAEPGGAWAYLNGGYIVASVMLEKAAETPFEALMDREVFRPLGVLSAGWGPPAAIRGHQPTGDASAKWKPTMLDNPPAYDAAGRLHVTLADWLRLCRPLLDEDGDFLTPESRAALLTPPDGAANYALGWSVIEQPALGTIYVHTGSNTVWYCQAVVVPQERAVLLVATNAGDASPVGDLSAALLSELAP